MRYLVLIILSMLALNLGAADKPQRFAKFEFRVAVGLVSDWSLERKFGVNSDIDTGSTPEDIWAAGGVYPFPAAALTTTIVSSDANDDVGGTGCTSVLITGLDINYEVISETSPTDGVVPVALTNNYFRVNSASCVASGSTDTNVGDVDVKHGATVIGRIPALCGTTQQMIFTVPADHTWLIDRFTSSIQKKQSVAVVIELQVKAPLIGTWHTLLTPGMVSTGSSNSNNLPHSDRPFVIGQKTDVRVRVTFTDANDVQISANASGYLVKTKEILINGTLQSKFPGL